MKVDLDDDDDEATLAAARITLLHLVQFKLWWATLRLSALKTQCVMCLSDCLSVCLSDRLIWSSAPRNHMFASVVPPDSKHSPVHS